MELLAQLLSQAARCVQGRRRGTLLVASAAVGHLSIPLLQPGLHACVCSVQRNGADFESVMYTPPRFSGFRLPLAGSGSTGMQRSVEALKHAFALRMHLGGRCRRAVCPSVRLRLRTAG